MLEPRRRYEDRLQTVANPEPTSPEPIDADLICAVALKNGFSAIERMYESYGSRNASIGWTNDGVDIENTHVRMLYQSYRELQKDDAFVPWRLFDCTRHRELLGDMHVLEQDQQTGRMRYRVFGTNVAHRYGKDLTGTNVADKIPSLAALYHGLFLAAARSGNAIYSRHIPPRESKVKDCQRLMLPFTDNFGEFSRLLVTHLPAQTRVGTVGSILSTPW